MSQTQSNTVRQLTASLSVAQALKTKFTAPQALKVAAEIREEEIARIEKIVADESEHLPNSIAYRDGFCFECDQNEYIYGTARQLAVKLFDAGWIVPIRRLPRLECLNCQGGLD